MNERKNHLDNSRAMLRDVYRFIFNAYQEYGAPRDYGIGTPLNMVEMQTLAMIYREPGVCVTDVAKRWGRTLGAASRNVDRLCKKGYVEKRKLPDNDKTVHIYPTELGKKLGEFHEEYESKKIDIMLEMLLSRHTEEELYAFHSVIVSALKMFDEES